ncbi:MAG: hypothetical protein JWO36_3367 [Myxococcales bacterium]|nr:hypothetical protein [Myxococcales bacterium]
MTRTMHFWFIGLALAGCADTPTPTTCRPSLTEFCATSSVPCPMTWSAAQDPTSWGGCGGRTSNTLVLESCNNVRVAELWGVDASTDYYYDASTGELLTVSSHLAIRPQDVCVAGAPQTEVCNDPAPRDLCP